MPVPVSVVAPRVSDKYEGTSVQLEFVVDVTGKPVDVVVKSAADYTVGLFVTDAVRQWRFKPAELDGQPAAKKVVLPVLIVPALRTGDRIARN